jgi:hypothetical protein
MSRTKTIRSQKDESCRIINENIDIHIIHRLRLNAVREGVTSPLFSVTPLLPDYNLAPSGITTGNPLVLVLIPVRSISLIRISQELTTDIRYTLNDDIFEDLTRPLVRYQGLKIS